VSYVEVDGHRVWHEVHGPDAGSPVVLLHGAFAGAESFAAQIPALVEAGFRVHVPERAGHGRTPDRDGPLTYARMAEETIAYLDAQLAPPSDLVGWSDGAVVAVLVAVRRPDLVRRLVVVGQYYHLDGRVPDSPIDAALAAPETIGWLREAYAARSPDGAEHFDEIYAKTMHMLGTEPQLDLTDLAAITAPTLVVQGDRDEVTLAHSQAVVAALPRARLAVLPGTHLVPIELPEVFNPLVVSFLAARER
jgi:pimeloyl-ACP methyl ester carboxylesterase